VLVDGGHGQWCRDWKSLVRLLEVCLGWTLH
jgi:hypothetical protein